jgi:putative flippase GtrA
MSEQKLSKKENIIQMVKFALFSTSAGIIQIGSFTALTELPPRLFDKELPYWICYLVSLVLSVIWNFTFNRKFTFKSANNIPIAMLKVAAFYAVFTPVSTYLGHLATENGANHYLVEIVTMLANLVTEYIYQRFVVFRNSINTAEKKAKKDNEEE